MFRLRSKREHLWYGLVIVGRYIVSHNPFISADDNQKRSHSSSYICICSYFVHLEIFNEFVSSCNHRRL